MNKSMTVVGNPGNVTTDHSTSFKYKSSILRTPGANGGLRNAKLVIPLKYLSCFFRSLVMPLINCKIYLELNWTKDCVMPNIAGATTFKITNTKLYVPIITLSTKDHVLLTKQLNEGFKRPAYCNGYKTKIEIKEEDENNPTRFYLDASFQGVKRFFVLAFDNTNNGDRKVERGSHRIYFLPRVNITNYNVLIDGRNFYDQPNIDQIKKYDEIRKTATGQGDDYTMGCLLHYQYFRDHYQLITIDLSKQKN